MRVPVALLLLTGVVQASAAAEPNARKTIDEGLKFLAEDAVAWKEDRKCASCHHIPMAIWTLNEARQRGYTIDDKARTKLIAWALAKDDPAKIDPKQPERKDVIVNQTPLMLALGFAAGDMKDSVTRDGLKSMLTLVLRDQDKDGAWRLFYVWEPHGSTPDVMTSLALLAITAADAPDIGAPRKAAKEKGLKWLTDSKPADTLEADSLRLVLWNRLGKPSVSRS
jgi:hypothetical protein